MFKRIVIWLLVLLAGGGAATMAISTYCPGLWTQIDRKLTEVAGWTEEARQADPVGFVEYASRKLRHDVEAMQKTRRDLAAEIGGLAHELRDQRALRDHARAMAEEFRAKYQEAAAKKSFPIEVRGAAYTAEQAKSQVSMLLAEAAGYEAAIAKLEEVRKEAESQLEALTVRIDKTESQLAALAAQREVLRVRKLSEVEEELLAQVENLLKDNDQAVAANPIRNVRELIAAAETPQRKRAQEQAVEAFLVQRATHPAGRVVRGPQAVERPKPEANPDKKSPPKPEAAPSAPVQPAVFVEGRGPALAETGINPTKKPNSTNPKKPVFQQF
jgi:hypothetical protein